ncbi:MAG TPA: DUF481 domain-containing protein [Hanamia sp.]
MSKFICLFSLLVCWHAAFSQFNDSTHHRFSLASTGIINQTQELSSFVSNNIISYELNQKKINFNTAASWVYGKQDKQVSNNDYSAFANLDYLKDIKRLYYWGLFFFDKSYSLKVNYRFQLGAGVAYNVLNKPNLNLSLSDGFVYESSDLTDPVIGKDVYQTVRNSFRLKFHWVYKDILVFDAAEFYQPSLASFNDYILKSNNSLSIKLNKWLAINASLAYNKISRTERENLLITYGLKVEKYF